MEIKFMKIDRQFIFVLQNWSLYTVYRLGINDFGHYVTQSIRLIFFYALHVIFYTEQHTWLLIKDNKLIILTLKISMHTKCGKSVKKIQAKRNAKKGPTKSHAKKTLNFIIKLNESKIQ